MHHGLFVMVNYCQCPNKVTELKIWHVSIQSPSYDLPLTSRGMNGMNNFCQSQFSHWWEAFKKSDLFQDVQAVMQMTSLNSRGMNVAPWCITIQTQWVWMLLPPGVSGGVTMSQQTHEQHFIIKLCHSIKPRSWCDVSPCYNLRRCSYSYKVLLHLLIL